MLYQSKKNKMKQEEIKSKVYQIIDEILISVESLPETISYNSKLSIILSESTQALEFITSIEEEFDFDFDDDEINISLFEHVDTLIRIIKAHIS